MTELLLTLVLVSPLDLDRDCENTGVPQGHKEQEISYYKYDSCTPCHSRVSWCVPSTGPSP